MLAFNRRTRTYVCKDPTDMRLSYDGLHRYTKDVMRGDPFSGHLFLFVNRRRTCCKCLYFDGTGFVIISKRLESGQFSRVNPRFSKQIILTQAEFSLFFEGSDLGRRFIDSPKAIKIRV